MKLNGFDELEEKIFDMVKTMPIKRNRFAAQQAEILVGFIKDETLPGKGADGGTLREGWQRTRAAQGAVEVYNNTDYAAHVEYGYRQKERWVPGYWEGDSFVYDKDAKTGMLLKPKFIKGKKMMHRGLLTYKKAFASLAGDMLKRILEED